MMKHFNRYETRSHFRSIPLALAMAVFFLLPVANAAAGTVTITGAGAGSGVVTVTGATKGTLITCTLTAGVTSGTCSASFGSFEIDTVTVAPGAGSLFAQWSVSTGGNSKTCTQGTSESPCIFTDTLGAVALTAEIEKPAVQGVATNAASNVTIESAKLNGSLRPESLEAEYFFEYGTDTSYGHTTTVRKSSSSGSVAATEAVSSLMPLTIYHYRLVARRTIEGKLRESDGRDETFTTLGVAPEIRSESTSALTSFSATLEATLNPGNSATTYYFVYGISPSSEQAVLPAAVASGYGSIQVAPRVLQALQPDTTYYYHVVAENSFGKVEGIEGPSGPEEKTFTTLPAFAPEASVGQVGEVGSASATVPITVDPNGLPTEYEIQLAADGAYTPVTVLSAGEEAGPQASSYGLSGLAPETTYQVRVLAWNAAGETTSAVQSFTTAASSAAAFVLPVTPVLVAFTPAVTPVEEATGPETKTKKLTNAQKLVVALKVCRKQAKGKRVACERRARKKYGPSVKKKGKAKK